MNIDKSKINFQKFKSEFEKYHKEDITETDTRSKILDVLLKDVLGWSEDNLDREKYIQVGYYDYLVKVPNFQFVIEAKRNLKKFNFPVAHKSTSINSIYNANKEEIDQIRSYLLQVGLQSGVLTNGSQFILGKFVNIDGTDWKKNKCIIFNSIDEIESRYLDFYNFLSKEAVQTTKTITGNQEDDDFAFTIYSSLSEGNNEVIRNTLSSDLTPILDEVFDEIFKYEVLDNRELIEECFVENKEILKNKDDIEKLFGDKPPPLSEVVKARNTQNIFNQIRDEIESAPIGLNKADPPKPIIIVGTKGAGKTTFINYLFKSVIEESFFKSRLPVYIDFRKYIGEDFTSINQRIYKDLISKIHNEYDSYKLYSTKVLKRIYLREIKEKDAGIWAHVKKNDIVKYNEKLTSFFENCLSDPENHFEKLSHYFLRERYSRLILIIDNADQFELPIQRDVFLLAQSLNKKAKCAIVLSLREGYYYEWRNKPPFDAFINNVYHVTAPPYKEVLQKRIDYALKNFKLSGKTKGAHGSGIFEITNESIIHFLSGLKNSLFVDDNSEILKYLEETNYPNLREGLKSFRDFLLSGHTVVAQYIIRHRVEPENTRSIPFWEFLKAIALLNKKYYSNEKSSVTNIFRPARGNKALFVKYNILQFLYSKIKDLGQSEKFILTTDLIEEFKTKGFRELELKQELSDLLRSKLIETDDQISDIDFSTNIEGHKNISLSLKGKYYIHELIYKFSYMELVLQDTPIFSKKHFESIRSSFPLANDNGKRSLKGRYDNMLDFLAYLEYQEFKENANTIITSRLKNNGLKKELSVILRKSRSI